MSDGSPDFVRFDRARRWSLPVVLWAFGIATTVLLIGIWGRAVAIDQQTVADAAQTAIDSEAATERVEQWLADALGSVSTAESGDLDRVAAAIADRPEARRAVDLLIADVVAGLFAEPGSEPEIRVDAALRPLVPVIEDEFRRADLPIEAEGLEETLEQAGTIELETGDAATVAAAVREAQIVLTWVVVVAGGALLLLGAAAVALADRRFAMVRTLSTRVVLSALSYALIFRIAAWALDPDRGRAPVIGSGAVVLGSNGHVFLLVAAIAAVLAVLGGFVAWRRVAARPSTTSPDRSQRTDDDTRELVSV